MAREWQPESRQGGDQPHAIPSADPPSADQRRAPSEESSGPTLAQARGPGGTTGWLRGGDFRRTSEPPPAREPDPEAETLHQPAVTLPDTDPRPPRENPRDEAPRDGMHREEAATPVEAPAPEGSRWQRFVGRSTGGGPLSEERLAQEQARQTPPSGEDAAPDRRDPTVEPGGTMDPNERMRRIAEEIRRGDRDPYTAEAYGDEEEEEAREGLARGGPLVWLIDRWKVFAIPLGALCMVAFVLATVGLPDLGGGKEVASSRGAPSGESGAARSSGSDGSEPAPLYDSRLSFSLSEKDDGTVVLSAGEDLTWTGRAERVSKEEAPQTETGADGSSGGGPSGSAAAAAVEVLRLSGPTAVEVGPGFVMDLGSENPGQTSTTVFAVEGEGVPDVHATFHLFIGVSKEGAIQRPNGTYAVTADSGELIAEGDYSDHRTGAAGGREVIRTYTEQVPGEDGSRQFRVRYEADKGVPIPLLAGWQTPEERPEDLRLEGER